MTDPRDRRAKVLAHPSLNGIDFVMVDAAQTRLRVHFLNANAIAAGIDHATITGGDTIPAVEVAPIAAADWGVDAEARPWVELSVAAPGDFSRYTLAFVSVDPAHPVLDRFFDRVVFSFKAGCPSTLDCEPPPHECPPANDVAPPIDYLAKDFESFRRALLEYSTHRYPSWTERSEADVGVMFAEALASLGDDLSYQQDRIAAEGWLETATQRRSLVRLARLVDYEPRVATAARVLLRFQMTATSTIPPGTVVTALAPDGELVEFETGTNLADRTGTLADPSWNAIEPWWFDDATRCLPRGATDMWIRRPARPLASGQLVLIETAALSPADAPLRQLVRLRATPTHDIDRIYDDTAITHITWSDADAIAQERDLTRTRVAANLAPATHGRRRVERFLTSTAWTPSGATYATIRTGPNQTLQFLHTLGGALAWLAVDEPDEAPRPELHVMELSAAEEWRYRRTLLGARPFDRAFTVDPVAYRALDQRGRYVEYDGDEGDTLRFGDGAHGSIPETGMTFEVTYRAGGGATGNVAAGALARIDPALAASLGIASVDNPFPAAGGRDREAAGHVRESAPQKFRAKPLRAVRREDYEDAAESLAWVQRAGTRFRYTGSWLSIFTAVDPRGTQQLPDSEALEVTTLLDRRRLAGYESFVLPPRYAALDVEVTLCVRPDAFAGDVHAGVLRALDAKLHADGTSGFFHPDRFTFGDPLERSALEAAVQDVLGVDGVLSVRYRRRGRTRGYVEMPDAVELGAGEILRVDNDPSHPEHGSVRIVTRGGK